MVICREEGADLNVAQLMPLPLTASCFSKIQIGFTFLVPALPAHEMGVCVYIKLKHSSISIFIINTNCAIIYQMFVLPMPAANQHHQIAD